MTGQIEQYLEQELASLKAQLAECQAEAVRYRLALEEIKTFTSFVGTFYIADEALRGEGE